MVVKNPFLMIHEVTIGIFNEIVWSVEERWKFSAADQAEFMIYPGVIVPMAHIITFMEDWKQMTLLGVSVLAAACLAHQFIRQLARGYRDTDGEHSMMYWQTWWMFPMLSLWVPFLFLVWRWNDPLDRSAIVAGMLNASIPFYMLFTDRKPPKCRRRRQFC